MNKISTFNNIQIGKKFKTSANITYQKISEKKSKPILNSQGTKISNGRDSSAFYNSKIKLTVV